MKYEGRLLCNLGLPYIIDAASMLIYTALIHVSNLMVHGDRT